MPMFGGDIVTVTTPDGRQVQMPSDLAASFPSLSVDNPDAPPSPPSIQPTVAPDGPVISPGPITSPAQLPGPQAGPITSPEQVAPGGPASAPARGPVTMPGDETGTQPVAPPPVQSNAQLAKNGPGQTFADQSAALDKEKQAVNQSAQVQADAATREGNILAARDVQTQKILEDRARQAAENEAELNRRINERDSMAKEIANTRIDRSVDHPIWSAIGLILSTIGTSMKLRPGEKWDDPAYNVLQQQLDRKVDAQMKDLDAKRQALGQMNVGVSEQRQHNMDRLAEIDVRKDAAIQQAQQMVQTMATQMKAPAALAAANELNAKLEMDRANLRGQASERAQAQINTERAQAQAAQFHREQMALERQKMAIQERDKLAAIAEKMLDQKNAARDKAQKDIAERAIWDPRTADVQLNPNGQAKMAQADQIEAAARQNPAAAGLAYIKQLRQQATTPEQQKQVDQLEARVRTEPQFASQAAHEYASSLRDDARMNDGVLAPDKATAEKVRPILGTAQHMTDQIDEAIKILEAGPSGFNREAWAGVKTKIGDLAKNYAQMAGEKVTVRGIDNAMDNVIGIDPDSMFWREASKNKGIASLKALKQIVADTATSTLTANGIKSGWTPVARGDEATTFSPDEKTANEVGQDSEPSLGQRIGARMVTLGTRSFDDLFPADREGAGADAYMQSLGTKGLAGQSGLSPNATTHLKALAARADAVGDKEHATIVESLADPIRAGLRDGGRASLAWGMLDVLGSANPGLAKEVIAALPPELRKRVESNEAFKAGNAPAIVPGSRLGPSDYDPDRAAASPAGIAADEQDARDLEARRLDAKAVLKRQQERYEEKRRAQGGSR